MFTSVFNSKRKTPKVHKKFSTIANIRRAQSPPSPASFASPEIVEINEKGPVDSQDHGPSASFDHSISSPQIQLDLDTDSLSDWLPPSISATSEKLTPPRRNVSLPYKAKALPDAPSTSRAHSSPEVPIRDQSELREPNRPFLDASIHGSLEVNEATVISSTRKPTPSPIKIPNYFTSSKIRVQRSAEEGNDVTSGEIPPPLPTKSSRPSSPSSSVTDDMSSAVSGTSLARALVVNSFILSSESRASKYKSGGGRQDSATLPRGEHPLINSPYTRERGASSGSPGSARSSSVPPVPRLPSRAELGLSMDSTGLHRRNSVEVVLDSADRESFDPAPQLRRPKSAGRLRREQSMNMPPISPISEAPSPAPSTSDAHMLTSQMNSSASSHSLINSVAPRRSLEGSASSSSLATTDGTIGGHSRAVTEPSSVGRPGTGSSSKSKESTRKGGSLAPNAAMPGTMRSSGAFALTNGRLAISRTISETGTPRSGPPTRPSVLLPIGERPASVVIAVSPQPPGAVPTPTSSLFAPPHLIAETPTDSPDLLDNFPLQIAPQRMTGPPPPLSLGRRSEDSSSTTPQYSSSGESMPSANDHRQTFPETPNAFSPLWTSTFQSPHSASSRVSVDRSSSRGRGVLEIMRMARGMSGSVYSKPGTTRASRMPPTPPPSGDSSASQPGSPMVPLADPSGSPATKRLTAIEEQVMSRAISTYSTVPEPPTSAAPYNTTFSEAQNSVDATSSVRGRDRSGSSAASLTRDRSISQDQGQGLGLTNGCTTTTSTGASTSGMSAAEQAKAAEASSSHRLRSVTNPDEPLVSPPPSYAPSFEPPPHTPPAASRSDAGDSSEPSRRSSSRFSGHLQVSSSSPSSIPQKRSLSPFPSPPNSSSTPSSPSPRPGPNRSRIDAHASSISVENPPPPYVENLRSASPPAAAASAAVPRITTNVPPPLLGPAPPARMSTPDLHLHITPSTARSGFGTPDGTPSKRTTRIRPPLPAGPRKPSYSAAAARMRAGSVSSTNTVGPSSSNPRVMSMMSHAAPKFQTSRVPFRGLTMEAAQWTLTSQQLQHIVSTAIRQSADASAIRILPTDVFDGDVPDEIARLEGLTAELKLKYKLNVRKRNTLLANANRVAESAEVGEHGAAATLGRMMDELSDVTEILDQTSEELYTATDQLAQLVHLRDVHQRSALAMALRKLNSSFLKQVGEGQRLREQVAMLEAERDEAWREAQEVAQEFDDFTDRIVSDSLPTSSGSGKDKHREKDKGKDSTSSSRRSSRVMVARRNSQRASKAGLRSMYRRSQRSSTSSSYRFSGVASPGVWGGPGDGEDIPPVPPIPWRHDLAIPLSADFPTSSMDSPSSDLRAMDQAQKELCEMLGISVDELKNHSGPSRRQSMSALPAVRSPVSAGPTRRNSDVVTPNHQKTFKMMSKEI
ncbi:hypothetical protein GSI_09113 [Ganoderma sinense ZZ0214-1]|uniref:Uncharacterized protein n=1 Tax=Ganoderma sinense ZZ0214-1 TaxID=1077348 RepID=A0A2G8S5P0_9APHY|nr:hypothetical protein GSI_09113 [Ganoderma sinense ZZ0214-1]